MQREQQVRKREQPVVRAEGEKGSTKRSGKLTHTSRNIELMQTYGGLTQVKTTIDRVSLHTWRKDYPAVLQNTPRLGVDFPAQWLRVFILNTQREH